MIAIEKAVLQAVGPSFRFCTGVIFSISVTGKCDKPCEII